MKKMLLVLSLLLGCYRNPPEQNRIEFLESTPTVADSLSYLSSVLDRLRLESRITGYAISMDDSAYFASPFQPRLVYSPMSDSMMDLRALALSDRRHLLSTMRFLRRNRLSAAFWDANLECWIWQYRYGVILDEGDRRYLYLSRGNEVHERIQQYYTIVSTTSNLLLLAKHGATIR